MLGMDDGMVALGYLLSIVSLIVCIVYGIRYWNRGRTPDENEVEEEILWEKEEAKIDEELGGSGE